MELIIDPVDVQAIVNGHGCDEQCQCVGACYNYKH
jgi:hypothetical protein